MSGTQRVNNREKIIKSRFAASGLVPYDPDRVLSALSITVRTPSPILSNESECKSRTPQNPRELDRQVRLIRIRHRRIQASSSPNDHALNQIVKACKTIMCDAAMLVAENRELQAVNATQKKKRAQRRAFVVNGGV